MNLRDVIAAGERRAVILSEEEFHAQQWEGVRAVAHRAATRGGRGDHGGGRLLAEAADPFAHQGARAAPEAIGRSWDRALAAYAEAAVGERPAGLAPAIDRGSRMTVRRPGAGSPAATGGADRRRLGSRAGGVPGMTVTLAVGGQLYQRWTAVKIIRGLKQVAAGFQISTPGEIDPPILPFAPCVLADDGEPIVTGYVDECRIEVSARATSTRITGRSKTGQLVDCMPQFPVTQFTGNAFDQIARAVAGLLGINVVIGPGVVIGGQFADATFEWNETAFLFLERLARQRGLLLTDDAAGNLVIATLGTTPAPAALVAGPGGNVFSAHGVLSGRRRFSTYTVRSQAGMFQTGGAAQNNVEGHGADPSVPLFRPWAGIAESALQQADAQKRADWEASHRLGAAVMGLLSVPEWRAGAAPGQLWQTNQLVSCTVPRLRPQGDDVDRRCRVPRGRQSGSAHRIDRGVAVRLQPRAVGECRSDLGWHPPGRTRRRGHALDWRQRRRQQREFGDMNMGAPAYPRSTPPSALDLWGDAVCEVLGVDDFEPEDIDRLTPPQSVAIGVRFRALAAEYGLPPAEIADPLGAAIREDLALIEEHNRLHPDEPFTDADIALLAPDLLGRRQ